MSDDSFTTKNQKLTYEFYKLKYFTNINDMRKVSLFLPWGVAAEFFSKLSRERISKQMFFHAIVDLFLEEKIESNLLVDLIRERCKNKGNLQELYKKEKKVLNKRKEMKKDLAKFEPLEKEEIDNIYDLIEKEYAKELEKIK